MIFQPLKLESFFWHLSNFSFSVVLPLVSSSSGGRYRPTWRPRREALNIDSIFTRPRGSPLGYRTVPGPSSHLEPAQDSVSSVGAAHPVLPGSLDGDGRRLAESEAVLRPIGQQGPLTSGRTMGPPAPLPPRGADHQPRLIQRMESGYESSERNSSSPDRWVGGATPRVCWS